MDDEVLYLNEHARLRATTTKDQMMARQPKPLEAPETLMPDVSEAQMLDLRQRWSSWQQAWARCAHNPSGQNQGEFEAECDLAEARYTKQIKKLDRRK